MLLPPTPVSQGLRSPLESRPGSLGAPCPSQVRAAQATRCLASTVPPRCGVSYHLPHPSRSISCGLRPQGPCRVGTGESGLVLSEEGNPAGEFPRETGLILRCAGKAGNPFQTTQGNRLSCRPSKSSGWDGGVDKTHHTWGALCSLSTWSPELLGPGKGTKRQGESSLLGRF